MSIRDEARQEAERRWPEWLQAAKRDWLRGAFEAGAVWASEQADREPSETEELARLRLERLEAVEDFITRHYLDTQMGERVLAIVNGIEEVRRADAS